MMHIFSRVGSVSLALPISPSVSVSPSLPLGCCILSSLCDLKHRERRKTHEQIQGVVPGLCGWQSFVFVCVCVFGVIPSGGEKEHINKFPKKYTPVKVCLCQIMCFSFFLVLFFLLPRAHGRKERRKDRHRYSSDMSKATLRSQ